MTAADQLTATVDRDLLGRLAAVAAKNGDSAASALQVTEMNGNLGVGTHLYRVAGTGEGRDWSYVLKIFDLPGGGYTESSDDPKAWNYWKREWLIYQAPWFRGLTGVVTPPSCLGTGTGNDGRLWIALEDMAEHDFRPWPLERFGAVARHFGQFNAAYLNERARPTDEWLSRHWFQRWAERSGPEIERLPASIENPLVESIYPPRIVEKFTQVWEGRSSLFRTLDSLPQSLCHLDVHIRNLFVVQDSSTVAIDWSYTGIAHLGADLAGLVSGSLALMEVPYEQSEEFESRCLEKYLEGLRAGGWSGAERDIELGYLISGVLQGGIGVVGPMVVVAMNEEMHPILEKGFGRPMKDLLESAAQLTNFWAQRIERIRSFMDF